MVVRANHDVGDEVVEIVAIEAVLVCVQLHHLVLVHQLVDGLDVSRG